MGLLSDSAAAMQTDAVVVELLACPDQGLLPIALLPHQLFGNTVKAITPRPRSNCVRIPYKYGAESTAAIKCRKASCESGNKVNTGNTETCVQE